MRNKVKYNMKVAKGRIDERWSAKIVENCRERSKIF